MDWEYPNADGSRPAERTNFGTLLKQLRTTFGSSYLLSAALGASEWRTNSSYDLPAIFGACDFVNMMTYDFNGWQANGPVGLNAPLYGNPEDAVTPSGTGTQEGNNVNDFVNTFLATLGVDSSKVILGIPTYGHVYKLANAANTAVYSAGIPTGATEDYNSICQKINSGAYTTVLDSWQYVPYAYAGTRWVGYESLLSAEFKANYIFFGGLGGAMFWSMNSDDYDNNCGGGKFPIISTVYNALQDSYYSGP